MRSTPCTAIESLARRVRLAVSEDQVRLALGKVEEHLRKVAVRPREPRPRVGAVVDVDGLVDEPQTCSVLRRSVGQVDRRSNDRRPLTLAIWYRALRISLSLSEP